MKRKYDNILLNKKEYLKGFNRVNKPNINRHIFKLCIRLFLLVIVISSTIGPFTLNAKDVYQEVVEEIEFNNNFSKSIKEDRISNTYIKVKDKEDFVKKEEYYETTIDINSEQENTTIMFDYELKTSDSIEQSIEVNDKEYNVSDEISLKAGENIIKIPETYYNNIEELDVMSNLKPKLTVEYASSTLSVGVVDNITDTSVSAKIYLPSNMKLANTTFVGYTYNSKDNSIDIDDVDYISNINIPLIVSDSSESETIEYEYIYGEEKNKETGSIVIDTTVTNNTTYISAPTTYKNVELAEEIGGNTEIDNVEELVNLYDLTIEDEGFQATSEEEVITSEDLINSNRLSIDSDLVFPISTTKVGEYTFDIKYLSTTGEVLRLPLTLEISKKDGINPIGGANNYAKNVALGKDIETNSQDNGVGIIGKDRISFYAMEYKIDALSHEITVRIDISEDLQLSKTDDSVYAMTVTDQSIPKKSITIDEDNTIADSTPGSFTELTPDLSDSSEPHYKYEIKTGSLESTIDSGEAFKRSGEYTIEFANGTDKIEYIDSTGDVQTEIKIAVPQTLLYNDGTTDILYGLIGDGVNLDTDQSKVSATDVVNPTTTGNKFGIYELESIGYEITNVIGSTSTLQADWSESDLTLTKYDHVIRPIDGNYLIASDIDATVTDEGTDVTGYILDTAGGFSTDTNGDGIADINDGFRPIGQIIGTVDGDDSVSFIGNLTGNVDVINGSSSDNTYIENLYINEPTINNVGLISITDASIVDNFGIVDPNVEGLANVGGIVGQSINGSVLKNVYALEKTDDSSSVVYDIKGNGIAVGGIVGQSKDTTIYSDEVFLGTVPGEATVTEAQPSNIYPDKDGYKTFNTLDVSSTSNNVGGIAGRTTKTSINKVYNKGKILGVRFVGGIVGRSTRGSYKNTYNKGKIEGRDSIGGIIGYLTDESNAVPVDVSNSYSSGDLLATGANKTTSYLVGIGGIVGQSAGNILINNCYSSGELRSTFVNRGEPTYKVNTEAGGIIGQIDNEVGATLDVANCYSTMNIFTTGGGNAGIVPEETTITTVTNSLFAGNIYYDDVGNLLGIPNDNIALKSPSVTITNSKYLSGMVIENDDTSYVDDGSMTVEPSDIRNVSWWTDSLFAADENIYSNWNIGAGNATVPTPDSDTSDESQDNDLGQVNRGYYPAVLEVDDSSGKASKEEVLEQDTTKMLSYDVSLNNYKIDAQTLSIYISLNFEEVEAKTTSSIDIYEGEYDISSLPSTPYGIASYTPIAGNQVVTLDGSTFGIKADQDYTIVVCDLEGTPIEDFVIHTPKQYIDDNGTADHSDDITYALIGDNVNKDSFVSSSTGFVNSTQAAPSINGASYGVYELESICYEEANPIGDSLSTAPADWTSSDLTLTKYDHIIHPCNGNYIISGNINATNTDQSGVLTTDQNGGWSTDSDGDSIGDLNDGFRPIGQKIGTADGSDSVEFTGEITKSFSEDMAYIKNLYINEASFTNVGLVAQNNGIINSIGSISTDNTKTNITGSEKVGSLAGSNDNTIINSYSFNNIEGKEFVGGLVGANSGEILNSYSTGNLLGENTVGGLIGNNTGQVTNTYAIGDVSATNSDVGGLIGNSSGTVDNSYSVSNVIGIINIGGLIGNNSGEIENSYATGNISGSINLGGLVGEADTFNLKNNYTYEEQKLVNNNATLTDPSDDVVQDIYYNSDADQNIVGNVGSGTIDSYNIASYINLTNASFYTDNAGNVAPGTGLGWESDSNHSGNNINVGGTPGFSWTSPWVYGQDTDYNTIIESDIGTYCQPHVMNDVNTKYDASDNDGSYVPEQPCTEITPPSISTGDITNYKINAMTLDITFKTSSSLKDDKNFSYSINEAEGLLKDTLTCSPTITSEEVVFKGSDCGIRPNTKYRIILESTNYKYDMTIYTPNQETMDYDTNQDGTITPDEENQTFALIGDGVNHESFVQGAITENGSNETVDLTNFGRPDTVLSSRDDSKTKAYGAYELESICYEDTNESISVLGDDATWDKKDLTISKYDHIVRTCDTTGKYLISNKVDALVTDEETAMILDEDGGWSTDTNADGIADTNDGFRPIGTNLSDFSNVYAIDCIITALNESEESEDGMEIKDIYINAQGFTYVGLIGAVGIGTITNINLTSTLDRIDIYGIPKAGKHLYEGSVVGKAFSGHINDNVSELHISGTINDDRDLYMGGILGIYEGNYSYPDIYDLKDDTFKGTVELGDITTANSVRIGGIAATTRADIINCYTQNDIELSNTINLPESSIDVGGIAADADSVISSHMGGDILVRPKDSTSPFLVEDISISGIAGLANEIRNTFYDGSIIVDGIEINDGDISIGGLSSYISGSSGITENNYTSGEIYLSYDGSYSVIDVGGLVGNMSKGTITRGYSDTDITIDGDVIGYCHVGGLIGQSYDVNQSNMVATGDIIWPSYIPKPKYTIATQTIGGAIGGLGGSESVLNNVYSYERQQINGASVTQPDIIGGNDSYGSYSYFATYTELTDVNWYRQTTAGMGIDLEPISDTIEAEQTWYGPYSSGYEMCMPILYKDEGVAGGAENTGELIAEQNCIIIEPYSTDNMIKLENYKINAQTLDIIFKTSDNVTKADMSNFSYSVSEVGDSKRNTLTCTPSIGDDVIRFKGTSCGIEPDNNYNFILESTEYRYDITVHTPKQGAGADGEITTLIDNTVLIGDGINVDTFIGGTETNLTTGATTDLVDTAVSKPSTSPTSSVVPSEPAYGIYELESIGYEDANTPITRSLLPTSWDLNEDLTITKYDHIFRPIDATYEIVTNIDASATSSNNNIDVQGGFGSDGYRPIGNLILATSTASESESDWFYGKLLNGTSEEFATITDLYINNPSQYYVGIVGSNLGTISGIELKGSDPSKTYITGKEMVGGIVGKNFYKGQVLNNHVMINMEGIDDVGGIVGKNQGILENNYSDGDITGNENVGGIAGSNYFSDITNKKGGGIIHNYATGDITGKIWVGGLVGFNSGNIINSYSTGDVVGEGEISTRVTTTSAIVGGLTGINRGNIIDCYTTSDVVAKTWLAGGLTGKNESLIFNSYATGDVTEIYNTPADKTAGGLVGSVTSDKSRIINSYGYETQNLIYGNGTVGDTSDDITQRIYYNSPNNQNIISKNNSSIAGEVDSYNIASYTQLIDESFYENNTDNLNPGSGLGWNSSSSQGLESKDWTSPWTEGTKICTPHVYNYIDGDGLIATYDPVNDGTYVMGQQCNDIDYLVLEIINKDGENQTIDNEELDNIEDEKIKSNYQSSETIKGSVDVAQNQKNTNLRDSIDLSADEKYEDVLNEGYYISSE